MGHRSTLSVCTGPEAGGGWMGGGGGGEGWDEKVAEEGAGFVYQWRIIS